MAKSVTFTIPLTVTISIGQPEIVEPDPDIPLQFSRRLEETKKYFQNQLTNQLGEITEKICDR